MKNLMDFSVGSIAYWAIGFGVMFGASAFGLFGKDGFFLVAANPSSGDGLWQFAFWIFQAVFAATAATIVSGAMAERTKFGSYLIASFVMVAFIYPLVGHWAWGGGWLAEIGFIDFAGSGVVHAVGGIAGLMGALILGARKGAFDRKSTVHKGHNMMFAGLGVFILWLGWFGFNPGSQIAASGLDNANAIALIAVNTNLAAAAGALIAMFLSWIRLGKPNVGMTLNGALAGLVAITAGCASVTPLSAIVIGAIGGVVMYFGVFALHKFRIDDPVGAVSVHGFTGIWGVIAVGIFDVSSTLSIQLIGIAAIAVWTMLTAGLLFVTLKVFIGLRVAGHVEDEGLDAHEHGIAAYC